MVGFTLEPQAQPIAEFWSAFYFLDCVFRLPPFNLLALRTDRVEDDHQRKQ